MTTLGFTTTLHKINRFIAQLSLPELLWPIVIIYLTVAAYFSIESGSPDPVLVYIFLLLCPGIAIIRLMNIKNPLIEWPFGIGLSIMLNTIVSFIVIQLSVGTWQTGFTILAAISLGGAVFQLRGWFSHKPLVSEKEDA